MDVQVYTIISRTNYKVKEDFIQNVGGWEGKQLYRLYTKYGRQQRPKQEGNNFLRGVRVWWANNTHTCM